MRWLIAVVVAFLQLGGAYGAAAVEGEVTGTDSMEVELTVEAPPGATMVAHLIEPGGAQQTVAMAERGSGMYGAFADLQRVNYVVVFEAVGEPPSDPVTLLDLGLDPAVLGVLPGSSTTAPDPRQGGGGWGWLGLAAGAAALALLAVWTLGGADGDPTEEAPDASEQPPATD